MAATTESKKMFTLRSSDGEEFEIEENVAKESQTIKPMIEVDCAESVIPLQNVNSKVLSKVIEYSKKHVDEELKAWDVGFVKSSKSRKRKRGSKDSGLKSSGLSGKRSRKESIKSKDTPKTKEKSADDEEEDDENGVPAEDDEPENSESKEKEFESEKEAEDDKENDPEEKSSGKKVDKGEGKSEESGESGPSMEDLRWLIIHHVKSVNLNCATFADMFKFFCRYFGIDLTPRKAYIKQIVEEEVAVLDDLLMKIQYDEFASDYDE